MGIKQAIDIDSKQKKELLTLFNTYLPNTKIWAYGSRVKWSAKPISDLDLVAFSKPAQASAVSKLKDALVESDLPFKVDLLIWDNIPNSFQVNIKENYFELQSDKQEGLPSGWRVVCLGDVVNFRRGHDLPKTKMKKGNIPVIGSNGIIGFHNAITTKNPCLSIGRSGNIGNPKMVSLDCWHHNTTLYVDDFKGNNPYYVYYFLKTLNLKNYGGGSAVPTLNRNHIHPIITRVPPLPEQKAIAHILGKLDDKIELNRQINQTLETMAQTLFKSWFVNFDPVIDNAIKSGNPIPDPLKPQAQKRKTIKSTLPKTTQDLFPNRFVFNDKLKKWIPEGWAVKTANDIAEISIGKTPPRKEQKWFETIKNNSNQTWVSIRNMGNCGVFIADSDECLTNESINKFNVKLVPKDTVILSFKLTVGRVAITSKQLCTNEAIAHFTNPKFNINSNYLFCYLKIFNYDSLGSTSSIATAVNSKIIKQMPILVPKKEVLDLFIADVNNYFHKIKLTTNETQTLTKLRDTLLPKLISGKIRVLTSRIY